MIQNVPDLTIINLIHCIQDFIVSFSGIAYQVQGFAEKALSDFWGNVKYSLFLTRRYKAFRGRM